MKKTVKKVFVTILAFFTMFLFGGIFSLNKADKTAKAETVTELTVKSVTYQGLRSNGKQMKIDVEFNEDVNIKDLFQEYFGSIYTSEYGSVPFEVNGEAASQQTPPPSGSFVFDAGASSTRNAVRIYLSVDYSTIESISFKAGTTIASDSLVIAADSEWYPTSTLSTDTYAFMSNVVFTTLETETITELTVKSVTYSGVRSNGKQMKIDVEFNEDVNIKDLFQEHLGSIYTSEYGSVPFEVNGEAASQQTPPPSGSFVFDAGALSTPNAVRIYLSVDYSTIESISFKKGTTIASDSLVIAADSKWYPASTLSTDTYASAGDVAFEIKNEKPETVTELSIKSVTYQGLRSNGVQMKIEVEFNEDVNILGLFKEYLDASYTNEYGSVPFEVNGTDPSLFPAVSGSYVFDPIAPDADNAVRIYLSVNDYSMIESISFKKGTTIASDSLVIAVSSTWYPTSELSTDTYASAGSVVFEREDTSDPNYFQDMEIVAQTKGDIVLPTEYKGYPCYWTSSYSKIMSSSGKVTRPGIWQPDVDVALTVESNEQQAVFIVMVLAKRVDSISLDKEDLGEFLKNETIDLSRESLTVTYDDGTTAKVVISQDMLYYDTSEVGEYIGLIQYRGVSTSFSYVVKEDIALDEESSFSDSTSDTDEDNDAQSTDGFGCNSTVEGMKIVFVMALLAMWVVLRKRADIIN